MNTLKFRTVQVLGLWVVLVALLALMSACQAQSEPAVGQNVPPTPEFDTTQLGPDDMQVSPGDLQPQQSDCPDLESQLFQLTQASDPLELAAQLQLKVKGDKILVLLVLDSERTAFLQDFGVEIDRQSGNEVQAFVPINKLCDLANTDEVLAIRLPAQAISQ